MQTCTGSLIFFNFAVGSIFKNCLLGQPPQSPRTSPADDGYAAKLLTISEENICIKILCDDGDGCDDETESRLDQFVSLPSSQTSH